VRRSVVVLVLASVVAAFQGHAAAFAASSTGSKRNVVASFYPLAYAAQRVGGDRVQVTNLTPAGAEPHDLELSPAQMDELLDAALVVEMGHGFQPAVERAADERDGPTVSALGSQNASDPHVWLDPVRMAGIVTDVQQALTKVDPSGRVTYRANADTVRTELAGLDARYRAGLADCARRLIVTSHEAFGYLAHRYGLRQEGVTGISPDAEADPKRIADLADLVKRKHVTVVFTETLVSPRLAETLAREAGVKTEVLDPLEGLSTDAQQHGASYFTVMDDNLRKLRTALDCK
jgi:zinc transport system substrate-binding protein